MAQAPVQIQKQGWIEVICGGMFSGKSEELIRRSPPRPDRKTAGIGI